MRVIAFALNYIKNYVKKHIFFKNYDLTKISKKNFLNSTSKYIFLNQNVLNYLYNIQTNLNVYKNKKSILDFLSAHIFISKLKIAF